MTQNKDLCLQDIARLKKFAPIAERFGLEPDGYFAKCTRADYDGYESEKQVDKTYFIASNHESALSYSREDKTLSWSEGGCLYENWEEYKEAIPTYRQDKLEEPLPDWIFDIDSGYRFKYSSYIEGLTMLRGQEAMEATVELAVLLDEHNLLEVRE